MALGVGQHCPSRRWGIRDRITTRASGDSSRLRRNLRILTHTWVRTGVPPSKQSRQPRWKVIRTYIYHFFSPLRDNSPSREVYSNALKQHVDWFRAVSTRFLKGLGHSRRYLYRSARRNHASVTGGHYRLCLWKQLQRTLISSYSNFTRVYGVRVNDWIGDCSVPYDYQQLPPRSNDLLQNFLLTISYFRDHYV